MIMDQKFCDFCGVPCLDRIRFSRDRCTAVDHSGDTVLSEGEQIKLTVSRDLPGHSPESSAVWPSDKRPPRKIIAAIAIIAGIAVIAAVLVLVVVPSTQYAGLSISPETMSTPPTFSPPVTPGVVITIRNATTEITSPDRGTPPPDPFPDALRVKDTFPFSSGSTAGIGTVYRVWMNDTYSWHNDKDNKYYVQEPHPGNKYLFVFVSVSNSGDTRFWPPMSSSITVHYNGRIFYTDPDHYLPDITDDPMAKPVEVKEVQYFSKLYGSEYVEDFGYSHGGELGYLYPGRSNAMDGYLIYEVPASLTLDKAFAVIEFNGKDTGVWKLG